MSTISRILAGVLLVGSSAAHAFGTTDTFVFVPPHPAANEPVVLRLDSDTGCSPYGGTSITTDVTARTIRVSSSLTGTTITPCPPALVTPIFVALGSLPRGTYDVAFRICANPPPPLPPCSIEGTEQLIVGGGDPHPVPALTLAGLFGLVVLTLATSRLRRRSRH